MHFLQLYIRPTCLVAAKHRTNPKLPLRGAGQAKCSWVGEFMAAMANFTAKMLLFWVQLTGDDIIGLKFHVL